MVVSISMQVSYKFFRLPSLHNSYHLSLSLSLFIKMSGIKFLAFFLCALFASSVISRTLEPIPKTSVLDVSASIQKTAEILSFNPGTMQQQQQEHESQQQSISSSNSLKLYSRDTLAASTFKTYRDLTLSRLERNSARVNFLYKKLYAALERNKTSELNLMSFEAPLTSGTSQGFGAYFARIGFGTPSKQLYTTIDTGSDITWIQCEPCTYCYKQTDPIFDPSTSSSYKPLTCDSQQCNELRIRDCSTNTCLYRESYGDGSVTTRGVFATETLTIGNSIIKDIAIGCGDDNEGTSFGASAGLFGLGRGSLSFPSQTKTSSFSYCLVDSDSTSASTLDFNSVMEGITVPLLRNNIIPTFYYVGLTAISVRGQMVPISPSVFEIDPSGNGGVIVDSGTTVTMFPTEVYNALRDEFVKGTTELISAAGDGFDTCFDVTSKTSISVPTVAFHFGQKSLSLPPNNYMRMVSRSVICFAFQSISRPLSIIGNFQQQGMRVTFDVGNSLIGFSPNQC